MSLASHAALGAAPIVQNFPHIASAARDLVVSVVPGLLATQTSEPSESSEPFPGWFSSDGMVRCLYNHSGDYYTVDADEDHESDDLCTVLDLLDSRGYEASDDPWLDDVLDDGSVRVYFYPLAA